MCYCFPEVRTIKLLFNGGTEMNLNKAKRSLDGIICIFLCAVFFSAPAGASNSKAASPCQGSINDLRAAYENNPDFHKLLNMAMENIQALPAEYPFDNPWHGAAFSDIEAFFAEWCTFLPSMKGGHDNGLQYIQRFAWFYYHNDYGIALVKESPGLEITQKFARERGAYLDSPASTATIKEWMQDPRVEIDEYVLPDPAAADGGFKSFNDFFSRRFKNINESRPQTMVDRDYIIAAPTDCIMNSIPQRISAITTKIQTKFNQSLDITELLNNSE